MKSNRLIRRRGTLTAVASVFFGAGALPAAAQNAPIKPEIMLLVGSSRSMERAVGVCNADGCVPADARCYLPGDPRQQPPGNMNPPTDASYVPTRMHLIKEALTGGTPGPFVCAVDQDCVKDASNPAEAPNDCLANVTSGEDNDPDAGHYHYRQYCCATQGAGPECVSFTACGADSGDMSVSAYDLNAADPNAAFLPYAPGADTRVKTDGILYQMRQDVKFGLMTYDSSLTACEGWKGAFSYPNQGYVEEGVQISVARDGVCSPLVDPGELANPGNAAARLLPRAGTSVDTGTFDLITGQDLARYNLGIKNNLAPYGGLVSGDTGLIDDPVRFVGESDANVISHNLFVATKVRTIVPSGSAPVAAALHDALEYYKRAASDNGDPANACRDRSLVFIGDEAPSRYVGGYVDNSLANPTVCARDADCNATAGGRCELPNFVLDPNSRASKAGHALCVYPDGYPYKGAVEYASELYQAGVPVYVVGFAPSKEAQTAFKSIADAGSPGRGPQGLGGYYRADNAVELREALTKIRNSQVAGNRSHTKPVILYPRRGNDTNAAADVRQWRFNAWSEVPGSADPFWYGRLERTDLACPAAGVPNPDSAARVVKATTEFSAVLAANANAPRRTVARNGADLFSPSGGTGANMFNADGSVGGMYTDPQVRTLTGIGAASPVTNELLRFVGRQMTGYFGTRGLPNGATGAVGTRSLGSIVNSEMTAILAPALPLTLGPYVNYANAHRDRPTMLATGANDGLVHLFRADNGTEVVNFVPYSAWPSLRDSAATRTVDGPLDAGDVVACRKYGAGGPAGCPVGLTEGAFRTMLVGSVGAGGSDIFGIDITNTTALAKRPLGEAVNLANLFQGGPAGAPRVWDLTPTTAPADVAARLGKAVSRPTLTHVRDGSSVRAAVIVGCGEDTSGPLVANTVGVGRCILVLDAVTGAKITMIDNNDLEVSGEGNLDMPVVGSAAVWPRGGIAPADRAYIGDRTGRLWRIDMRSTDPEAWKIRNVTPGVLTGYRTGRQVVGRPAVFQQSSGKLAVLYTTSTAAPLQGDPAPPAAFAVSLSDGLEVNAQGALVFYARPNWVFPFGYDEVATGEVSVVSNIALFTTSQAGIQVCASAIGRMYGVHATDIYRDANYAPATFRPAPPPAGMPADPRVLNVKPMLPNLRNPAPGHELLAVQLPPGRVAYGVTVAEVPSCTDGEATSTEVVMNLADDERGRRGAPRPADMYMESVENGQITRLRYDNNMFAKAQKTEMSLCLNCNSSGKATGRVRGGAPFASSVSYWGSTFTE